MRKVVFETFHQGHNDRFSNGIMDESTGVVGYDYEGIDGKIRHWEVGPGILSVVPERRFWKEVKRRRKAFRRNAVLPENWTPVPPPSQIMPVYIYPA